MALLLASALAGCGRHAPKPTEGASPPSSIEPVPNILLPDGCGTAVEVDLASMRASMPGQGAELIARLSQTRGLTVIQASGLDPWRDFHAAALCRQETDGKARNVMRLIGNVPSGFLGQFGTQLKESVSTMGSVLVLKHEGTWIGQRGATELFFADDEALLGAVAEERTRSYAFPSDGLFTLALDVRAFQSFSKSIDLSKVPEFESVRALFLTIDRDRSDVSARFTATDRADATALGVALSRTATAWKRAGKLTIQPEVRIEGREAVVAFRLPAGALDRLLQNLGGARLRARQPATMVQSP